MVFPVGKTCILTCLFYWAWLLPTFTTLWFYFGVRGEFWIHSGTCAWLSPGIAWTFMLPCYQVAQNVINWIQAWGSVGERATRLCCHLLERLCYKYNSQVKAGTSFGIRNAFALTQETTALLFPVLNFIYSPPSSLGLRTDYTVC